MSKTQDLESLPASRRCAARSRRATDFRAGDPNYQEPVVEDPRALDPRAGERGYEEPPMEEAPPMDPRAIDARGGEIPREGPPMEGEDGVGSFLPAFAPT